MKIQSKGILVFLLILLAAGTAFAGGRDFTAPGHRYGGGGDSTAISKATANSISSSRATAIASPSITNNVTVNPGSPASVSVPVDVSVTVDPGEAAGGTIRAESLGSSPSGAVNAGSFRNHPDPVPPSFPQSPLNAQDNVRVDAEGWMKLFNYLPQKVTREDLEVRKWARGRILSDTEFYRPAVELSYCERYSRLPNVEYERLRWVTVEAASLADASMMVSEIAILNGGNAYFPIMVEFVRENRSSAWGLSPSGGVNALSGANNQLSAGAAGVIGYAKWSAWQENHVILEALIIRDKFKYMRRDANGKLVEVTPGVR